LSPESEPSLQRFAELTKLVKEKKVSTIFFETLANPKLADTLVREVGAQSSVLNPIEGLTTEEQTAGKDYDIVMKENLHTLETALVCNQK
jgi:zinc transport system substrate-binding protein